MIGAGNVATVLGRALLGAGHDILQVYSRTGVSASRLAEELGASPVTDLGKVTPHADVYVVAVKDSVIAELVPRLCKGREEKVFLHTAGSIPMGVFEGMALHYGVMYPMQTFSKDRPLDFGGVPCFIEWNDDLACETIGELARSVSGRVAPLNSESRKYLHLAAVFACNFVNHCYEISSEILARHGVPFDIMLPLIDETARKVHDIPPVDAQTGPAVRYDRNVIRMQADMLRDNPIFKQIYEAMSLSIHHAAQGKGE